MANVTYPGVYHTFLGVVEIFNFDLSWIIPAECITDVNFHHRLVFSTQGPLFALTILGAMYVITRRRGPAFHGGSMTRTRDDIDQSYLSTVLMLTFLVYSTVTSKLFQMFACDKLDDGRIYLRADYQIDCNSPAHKRFQIYAAWMIVVYTVGIPLLYGILLFRKRQVLVDERVRQEDKVAKSMSNLWELYTPNRYYYELIECGRRIILAGVVVFILPNTVGQVATTLMIGAFFMVLSEIMSPYASVWDAWSNRIGHAIFFSSIYLALLLKIDVSGEREPSQRMFGVILVAVHALMFLIATFEGVVVVYQWLKRQG